MTIQGDLVLTGWRGRVAHVVATVYDAKICGRDGVAVSVACGGPMRGGDWMPAPEGTPRCLKCAADTLPKSDGAEDGPA